MPKRTNDFQRLVYLVRVNLADGATVTESKMLRDRVTNRQREVDVCIEGKVGQHAVVVSVECQDHKRIADVSWVERMKGKHDRLPTHALILASRKGFTREARDVAAAFGIHTFSLEDVDKADFPAILGSDSTLWSKSFTVSVEKVLVRVLPTADLPSETVAVMPNNLVYSADGNEEFEIYPLVEALLKSKGARDYLLSQGKEEHAWFEIGWAPPRDHLDRPLFMKRVAPEVFREIESIQIKGPCKVTITQFGMRSGKLGEVNLAWGKVDILGHDALVVATKDALGIEKLSVNIKKQPSG